MSTLFAFSAPNFSMGLNIEPAEVFKLKPYSILKQIKMNIEKYFAQYKVQIQNTTTKLFSATA